MSRRVKRRAKWLGNMLAGDRVKLGAAQVAQGERDERNLETFRKRLASAQEYQFQGEFGPGSDGRTKISVTDAQCLDTKGRSFDLHGRIVPIGTIPSDKYPKAF